MTNTLTTFAIGDRVKIRDEYVGTGTRFSFGSFGLEPGDTATITHVHPEPDGYDATVSVLWDKGNHYDNGSNGGGGCFQKPPRVAAPAAAPPPPPVHFAAETGGRDRSTAREACAEAVSRVLPPPANQILREAASGKSVDAYALNDAITKAIRSAATRHGQSTARREQAKRFAHVAHIVQAVLENHADNLPAYGPGERSRALADLKAEVASSLAEARREVEHAGKVNQSLTQDLTAARAENDLLKQAASDERRRICGDLDTARANLAQTIREANEFEAALEFVLLNFCSDEDRLKVEGFRLGFAEGSRQD